VDKDKVVLRRVGTGEAIGEDASSSAPAIEPLSRRDALMALVTRAFRLDITDMGMVVRQLAFLQRVAACVSIRRPHVPEGLESLPAVRAAVLADLRAEAG
jgi:hypothetical protein